MWAACLTELPRDDRAREPGVDVPARRRGGARDGAAQQAGDGPNWASLEPGAAPEDRSPAATTLSERAEGGVGAVLRSGRLTASSESADPDDVPGARRSVSRARLSTAVAPLSH